MRTLRNLLAALIVSVSAMPALANDRIYDRVVQSTVLIVTADNRIGTGTLIDRTNRLVITANHVVSKEERVATVFAELDKEGRPITRLEHYDSNAARLAIVGKVISRSPNSDLALIQLDSVPQRALFLPMATQGARPGMEVHVIGNSSTSRGMVFNYSGGGKVRNVSDFKAMDNLPIEGRIVETGIAANKGDSGGPIVNERSELVAVVSRGTTSKASTDAASPFHDEQVVVIGIDVKEVRSLMTKAGFSVGAPLPAPIVRGQNPYEPSLAPRSNPLSIPFRPIDSKEVAIRQAAKLFDTPPALNRLPISTPVAVIPTRSLVGGVWKEPQVSGGIDEFQFSSDGVLSLRRYKADQTILQSLQLTYRMKGSQLVISSGKDALVKEVVFEVTWANDNEVKLASSENKSGSTMKR